MPSLDFNKEMSEGGFKKGTIHKAINEDESPFDRERISWVGKKQGSGCWVTGKKSHLDVLLKKKFGSEEQFLEFLASTDFSDSRIQEFSQSEEVERGL